MLPEFTREELAAGLDRVAEDLLDEAGVERRRSMRSPSPAPWASPWPGRPAGGPGALRAAERSPAAAAGRRSCCGPSRGRSGRNGPWPTKSANTWPVTCSPAGASIRARRRPTPAKRWPTIWRAGCCCRRPGSRPTARRAIGTRGPESPLRHGQPRIDRAADAGMPAVGDHQHFRPTADCRFGGATCPAECRRRRRPRWSAGATFTDGNHPLQTRDGPPHRPGWPIHEEGWKREILHTEAEEFACDVYDCPAVEMGL